MDQDGDPRDAFVRTRRLLLSAAGEVPPRLRTTAFVGHWNLMDLLAHLIGWDIANLGAVEALTAGETPAFYRHYDPGWTAYNQRLIERYGSSDWASLIEAITRSQEAVVASLRALSRDELAAAHALSDRGRPVSIAAILRAAIADEREHLSQIEAFGDSQAKEVHSQTG